MHEQLHKKKLRLLRLVMVLLIVCGVGAIAIYGIVIQTSLSQNQRLPVWLVFFTVFMVIAVMLVYQRYDPIISREIARMFAIQKVVGELYGLSISGEKTISGAQYQVLLQDSQTLIDVIADDRYLYYDLVDWREDYLLYTRRGGRKQLTMEELKLAMSNLQHILTRCGFSS